MADFNPKVRIFTIYKHLLIIAIAFALLGINAFAEPTTEKQALLNFISKINHNGARLKWHPFTHVCNWTGVICNQANSHIRVLRLPGLGLAGEIPPHTITQLTDLRVLSLRNNRLSGSVPPDFVNLTLLTHLFLQHNHFSGYFPDSITAMPRLARLDLSRNRFQGQVPASINNLQLQTLFLQNNLFSGKIPSLIDTLVLIAFDISNNNLSGEIPKTLSGFPPSSFSGNAQLCGKPLSPCSALAPSPPPISDQSNRLPTHVIAIINVICVTAAFFFILFLIYIFLTRCRRRRPKQSKPKSFNSASEFSIASPKANGTLEPGKNNGLVFFEPEKYGFDLQSLLGASAEVLGKGSTGTSYKAEMDCGTTVSVKRLKEIVVGKKEFDSHMTLLGQLRHENVVKLIAYYYCKDEKLVISDFIPTGSLSSLLHGSRGSGRVPTNWVTRFRIGLTAARGLHYIHATAKLPHGNIKSSNVLVTESLEACLSDYGMQSLFGPPAPNQVAGYGAPEVQQQGESVSFKSDVYSFGVLLLEMLTGKSPNQVVVIGEDGIDLPRWVQSVAAEDFEVEVFDAEVLGSGAEEEMVAVLQVAMKCVEVAVENRPEMWEVLRMLEMVESGDELMSPCMCKGTQQFVHRSCLDHWRSVKEGFAFSHCTTCKAQFHLRAALYEDNSWHKIKFRLFVARDVFLAVQTFIAVLSGSIYVMDKDGTFRNSFGDGWDRVLSKHPIPFYYCIGVLLFFVVIGFFGLLVHCSSMNTIDPRLAGCRNGCYGWGILDCFPASVEACLALVIIFIVIFAILGIAYGFLAATMGIQRIWQKHYHILTKRELTKEYMVEDLNGNYTPTKLEPEHEQRLKLLKLL